MADGKTVWLPGDGLRLRADVYGPIDGDPVLFLHGGGQSRRSWRGAARKLAGRGYRALTADLRGHGESEWAADGDYRLDAFARDVGHMVEAFDRPIVLAGASRGGQAAFVAAAARPDCVRLVLLADVAPSIRDAGVDRIRGFFADSLAGFANEIEAAAVLKRHFGSDGDPARLRVALRRDGRRLFWRWDPKSVSAEFLNQPSEGDTMALAARIIRVPVMLVRGALSDIVSAADIAAFRELTPHVEVLEAAGVGHMLTGDSNDVFAAALIERLSRPER